MLFSLNEFFIPVVGGIVLTHFIGGVGIWIALTLGEVVPISIYIFMSRFKNPDIESRLSQVLILDASELLILTYYKKDRDNFENYLVEGSQIILAEIGEQYTTFIYDYGRFINRICLDIFDNSTDEKLDITIKFSEEEVLVSITNEDLSDSLKEIDFDSVYSDKFKYDFHIDYDQVLGLNKLHVVSYPVADE